MANPWSQLVRMLELRIARQQSSLQESQLQLDAAKKAFADQEAADKAADKQLDLVKKR